jgi:hypothetical protein
VEDYDSDDLDSPTRSAQQTQIPKQSSDEEEVVARHKTRGKRVVYDDDENE